MGPSEEKRRLAKLFAEEVAPAVNVALTLHRTEAEEMNNNVEKRCQFMFSGLTHKD